MKVVGITLTVSHWTSQTISLLILDNMRGVLNDTLIPIVPSILHFVALFKEKDIFWATTIPSDSFRLLCGVDWWFVFICYVPPCIM